MGIEERSSKFWSFRKDVPRSLSAPSRLLAEQVPLEITENNIRHTGQRQTPAAYMQSAWSHVEFALNRQSPVIDDTLRRTYLGYASQLLANVLDLSSEPNPLGPNYRITPQQTVYHEALLLNSYLPVFTKRALGKELTRNDSRDLYKSLGVVLNGLLEYGDGADAPISEVVTSALSARITLPEHLLYLSSPREEGSHVASGNHDRYFLQGDTKQPVEIKLGGPVRAYDPEVTVLNIEDLLVTSADRADLPATGATPRSHLSGRVHQAADLIALETSNCPLSSQENAFLNLSANGIVRYHRRAQSIVSAA